MPATHNSKERPEYVTLSDVHLTELETVTEAGWWEYKSPDVSQDEVLCEFMVALDERRPAAFSHTVLIFNGDTFDCDSVFSAPDNVAGAREGIPSDAAGSAFKMNRILADHERFVRGLAQFVDRGNRAVFVLGNHDRELHFQEAQRTLLEAVSRYVASIQPDELERAIQFEPWFVHVPGVLYVEHGQQYDSTCSFRDVLRPTLLATDTKPEELEMSFGSVIGRRLLSRLGTVNPYNDESFLMGIGGYARHMLKYYFPKKPYFRAYLGATLGTLLQYFRQRPRVRAARADDSGYVESHAVTLTFLAHLRRLASRPISDRLGPLLHELWLDRFVLLVGVIAAFVVGVFKVETLPQGLALLSFIPIVILSLRAMGRGSLALQERGRWGLVAEEIATHLPVQVVAFGHSHRPERRRLSTGGAYYNLGSWAPLLPEDSETTLARARRFLVVRPGNDGEVHVDFLRWADGQVVEY